MVQEQVGGSPSANYLVGLAIDERFARTDATGTSYYLADALGSTVALADGTATVQTTYTYEPYGATTQGGTGGANPARYTGREEDGTGLYYYRARYFDPRRQRFLAEDPLGLEGGDVNLHRYARDNPSNYSDPLGLWVVGFGGYGNLGTGVGVSVAVVPSVASNGDIGIQIVVGGQAIAGGGGSAGAQTIWSPNASRLSDMNGWFVNAGGSFGEGIVFGADGFTSSSGVSGAQLQVGAGLKGGSMLFGEGHAGASYTWTFGFNICSVTGWCNRPGGGGGSGAGGGGGSGAGGGAGGGGGSGAGGRK